MTLKHTVLHQKHLEAGAKMGEFAGWEMPLYYGSQIAEHNKVRQDAGMFDVSHMNVAEVKGKEARNYLHYLIANDVDKLKEFGRALYSCMLNKQGGVIDDLIVYRFDEQNYRVVTNAATHDKDLAWLKKQAGNFDVEIIERPDFAMIAIQGPNSIIKTQSVLTEEQRKATEDLKVFQGALVNDWLIARTGYTGEDGYEIILPGNAAPEFWQALLKAGVAPCGLVARDSLRLEAGLSLYGSDMDETTTPLESNLEWTVAWQPEDRDFVGRKALEDQKQAGVKRNIYGLILDKGKGILRSHQKVTSESLGQGEITSGGFSPTLGFSVALARLPIETHIGDNFFVTIHGKQVSAKVVKPPFVRKGKKVFEEK